MGNFDNLASDRRRHPRYSVEIGNLVGFSCDGKDYEGVISDISFGGMCIRATESLPVIEDSFTLMHGVAGPLQVRQSWCKGSAMGIEFNHAKDSELARSLRCVQILLNGDGDDTGDSDNP